METNDRITAILAHLRGDIVRICTQKKLNKLDKELGTQDWNNFVKEIKIKAADAKWKIESFKQEKRNTVDFIIEFETLAIKADTDKLYAIFLLKKNIQQDIIKIILGYLSIAALSYTSPLVRKQCSHGETTSEPYKLAFHSSHLSCNTSHSNAATLQIFRLPRWRYSYSTQSSMTELLLSVSQH